MYDWIYYTQTQILNKNWRVLQPRPVVYLIKSMYHTQAELAEDSISQVILVGDNCQCIGVCAKTNLNATISKTRQLPLELYNNNCIFIPQMPPKA